MKPTSAALLASFVALTGCAAQVGDEPIGVAEQDALSYNALSYNALSYNALSYNALSYNALSYNALSYNSLTALQDPSPTGDLARQLLSYTVGCALDPSQSLTFSYTDTTGTLQTVTDDGQLGLDSSWATQPLTDVGTQQDISACLAARTNYFGITVHISVRGEQDVLQGSTSPAELAAYPYVEGAFWGNLFAPTPSLYSCYDRANAAHSDADMRVCATGYTEPNGQVVPCGMITLTGSCWEQCDWFDQEGQLYRDCGDSRSHSITIGLQ